MIFTIIIVMQALTQAGWEITDDSFILSYGGRDLYVDLGAEHDLLAAQRDRQKIAVEIKSFLSQSPVYDLQSAIGQYDVYRSILEETEPNRILYLAVPKRAYETIFSEKLGQLVIKRSSLQLIIFDEHSERIEAWIP
ncbi:MAG: element excision factor XisH family protein [Cyanobacteria bacterium P01_C01_bin.120]